MTDASGGPIIQIARGTDSKLTAERRSASTAAWSTWTQDIKAISDGLANKAEASALSSLDSKVSVIDGKFLLRPQVLLHCKLQLVVIQPLFNLNNNQLMA